MDKYLSKCRTCLKRNGTVSLLTNEEGKTLRDIMSCFSIEISDIDVLPQYICRICSRTIIRFQAFKQLCEETDQLLKEIIENASRNGKKINPHMANDFIENKSHRQFEVKKKRVYSSVARVETRKKKKHKKSSEIQFAPKENQSNEMNNLPREIENTSEEEKCNTNAEYIFENKNCIEFDDKPIGNGGKIHNLICDSIQNKDTANCGEIVENIKKENNRITLQELHCGREPVPNTAVRVPKKKRRLRKYLCASCGYAANDKCSLRVHTRLHTGEKPYACTQCERRFAVKANLNSHIQLHSGSRRFVCEVCGRSFTAAASLRGHAHVHTGAKPHVCKTCSRAFASASNLRAHSRTHSDERPYGCDVCSRAFKSTSELHQHERRHTAARPHACAQCARSFALASNLSAHVRTHAPAEHNCVHCNRTFTCKAALSAHQRVHGDSRRFACEHCGKRFSRKATLNTHYRTHKSATTNIHNPSITEAITEQNTYEDAGNIAENFVQISNSEITNREKNSQLVEANLIATQNDGEKIDSVVEMIDASNSLCRNVTKNIKVRKRTTNKNLSKINVSESFNKKQKSEQLNATSNSILTASIGNIPMTPFIRMIPIQTGNMAQQKMLGTPMNMINVKNLQTHNTENNCVGNLQVSNESGVRILHIQKPDALRVVSNQIPFSYIPILTNEMHSTENLPRFLPIANNVIENNRMDTNSIAESNQNIAQTIQINNEKRDFVKK